MTREEKIICKHFLNDADKTHSCNEYKLLMELLEQEPTTKNNLGVDLVSRADVLKLMQDNWHAHNGDWAMQESIDAIRELPSVTPQEPILGKIRAEIEPKCDRINSLASVLPYTAHREIQELLCDIMDLCKADKEAQDVSS